MKYIIIILLFFLPIAAFCQAFSQADSITVDGTSEKVYVYDNDEVARFRNFTKKNFLVDPFGKTGYLWGINSTGNGFSLKEPIWTRINDSTITSGSYDIRTGQTLIATDDEGVLTYDHDGQFFSVKRPRWTLSGTHLYADNAWTVGLGVTSTTALTKFDMGQDFKAQKLALVRLGNFVMGIGTGTGTMRYFTSTGNANGMEWGQVSDANGTSFTRQMQLNNSAQLIVGGTATPADASDKVYAIGNVKATQFLTPGSFTHTQAAGLSPSNGDIIYISSTGGSFTGIGFYGYANSAWAYLGADGTGTDDQTAAEVSYDNSTSGLTATDVKAAIDEVTAAIPDNISDLTISADVDINNNKLTNVKDGTASSDAATYGQLTASHALDLIAGVDGDTIVLDTRETLLALDGGFGDPATFYIDGSVLGSGAKIYIKYVGFSSGATLDRDDDNDPGNFIAVGAGSGGGTTTLSFTGTGTSMLLKSGSTWYQMY